jgi:hypothetical protein
MTTPVNPRIYYASSQTLGELASYDGAAPTYEERRCPCGRPMHKACLICMRRGDAECEKCFDFGARRADSKIGFGKKNYRPIIQCECVTNPKR